MRGCAAIRSSAIDLGHRVRSAVGDIAPTRRRDTISLVVVDDHVLDARVQLVLSVDALLQEQVFLHSPTVLIHLQIRPALIMRYHMDHNLRCSYKLGVAQVGPVVVHEELGLIEGHFGGLEKLLHRGAGMVARQGLALKVLDVLERTRGARTARTARRPASMASSAGPAACWVGRRNGGGGAHLHCRWCVVFLIMMGQMSQGFGSSRERIGGGPVLERWVGSGGGAWDVVELC